MKLPDRDSDGSLPAYVWPGGYPIYYQDRDGSELCADCATKSLDDTDEVPQFKPVAYAVHYEGPAIFCGQCNEEIESAYGDPDMEEEEEDEGDEE